MKYKYKNVKNLSGGETQRVAIIRALLKDTPVIICDEPTGNLDKENSENVFSILKEISKEKLVIVITHSFILARNYSDVILMIKNKNLLEEKIGNVENLNYEKPTKEINYNYGLVIKIGLITNIKDFLRPITFIILQIFCFLIFLLTLTISFYDNNKDFIKTNEKYGIKYAFLNGINIYDDNIEDSKVYNVSEVNVHVSSEEDYIFINKIFYSDCINEEGIIITDYIYDLLDGSGDIEYLYLDGIKFKISKIIKTDYLFNGKFKFKDNLLIDIINLELSNVFMSKDNFEYLLSNRESLADLKIQNYKDQVIIKNREMYEGITLDRDEIVFPTSLNIQNKFKIDDQITLKISDYKINNGEEFTKSFIIKGFSDELELIFNYSKNNFIYSFYTERNTLLYEIDNNYSKLINKYNINSFVKTEIERNDYTINLFKKILICISITLLLSVIFCTINYVKHIVTKSKKNIYILNSLGYDEQKVKNSFILFIYLLFLISFSITILFIEIMSTSFNKMNTTSLNTYWFQFNYLYFLFLFIAVLITYYLSIYLLFKKDKNKSLSQRVKIN